MSRMIFEEVNSLYQKQLVKLGELGFCIPVLRYYCDRRLRGLGNTLFRISNSSNRFPFIVFPGLTMGSEQIYKKLLGSDTLPNINNSESILPRLSRPYFISRIMVNPSSEYDDFRRALIPPMESQKRELTLQPLTFEESLIVLHLFSDVFSDGREFCSCRGSSELFFSSEERPVEGVPVFSIIDGKVRLRETPQPGLESQFSLYCSTII